MAGNGWIMTAKVDEATVATQMVWGGDDWLAIADYTLDGVAVVGDSTLINGAETYADNELAIENIRIKEAQLSQTFNDRYVEKRRVTISIAFA